MPPSDPDASDERPLTPSVGGERGQNRKRGPGVFSKRNAAEEATHSKGPEADSTDLSVDADDSEPPLILGGAADSTNFSEADPSSGTVSEGPGALAATIDLPDGKNPPCADIDLQLQQDQQGQGADEEGLSATRTATIGKAPVFRPTRRPPMAVLRIEDDGGGSRQEVRIRRTPFDIGRLEGDVTIPHELQMSRRHARIDRKPIQDKTSSADRVQAEWTLTDLRSLNGTFIRRTDLVIRDRAEVLLGGELVRFLLPDDNDNLVLVKVGPGRNEEKLTLRPGTAWIGSDVMKCAPFLVGNPFLDAQRLRLDADRRGRWTLTDLGSTNGVWVRIESVELQDGDEWQSGEQRFAFSLP